MPAREPRRLVACRPQWRSRRPSFRLRRRAPTLLELRGIPVLAGVELDDAWVELIGECRPPGLLVASHRHNDVVRLEAPVARLDHEAGAVSRQPVDTDAGPDRGARSVPRTRPGSRPPRPWWRTRRGRTGEGHARQGVVAGGREEAKRVPAPAPRVADSLVRVQDQEGKVPPGEVVPDREARLSGATTISVCTCSGVARDSVDASTPLPPPGRCPRGGR